MSSLFRHLVDFLEKLIAFILIVILLPIFLIISILIFLIDDQKILFKQIRVGCKGKLFKVYKFRTMKNSFGEIQITSSDDKRITKLGKTLRKFKLDELPQLFNILNGTMSFVGYRPEVPMYVDLNNKLWEKVLTDKPGITSKATILFRSEENILKNTSLDKEYFYKEYILPCKLLLTIKNNKNKSFIDNLRTIFETFLCIIYPSAFGKINEKDVLNYFESLNKDISRK